MNFDFTRSQKMHALFQKTYTLPPMILVGGTNGKGSTLSFLSQILQHHGRGVATYTSPHLFSVQERIKINQHLIQEKDFDQVGDEVLTMMNQLQFKCTYFETLTFMAAIYFAQQKPDLCIFEVGLGGRFDTTHAFDRIGSILTKIDLDHTQLLGNTLSLIAKEKLPILQKHGLNVVALQHPDIQKTIQTYTDQLDHVWVEHQDFTHNQQSASFVYAHKDLKLSPTSLGLQGDHQATNASLAITMAYHVLPKKIFNAVKVQKALTGTRFAGRMDVFQKGNQTILVDVAHNPAGIKALANTLSQKNLDVDILFGSSLDKDAQAMIEILSKLCSTIYTTGFDHPRAWQPTENLQFDFDDPLNALATLLPKTTKPLLITGSIFLIGSIYPKLDAMGFKKL